MSEQRCLLMRLLSRRRWVGRRRGVAQESPRWSRVGAGETPDPRLLVLRHVRAARVQLLVARHQVGAVRLEPVEPDLPYLAAEVKRDAGDVDRAGLARDLHDLLDLLRRVVHTRDEGSD